MGRRIPVLVLQDPAVAIRMARRRFTRLAGIFERAGHTVAWWREYLIVQQPLGVMVIDCMAGDKKMFRSEADFRAFLRGAGTP